jgi:hypothetical protein
VEVEVVQLVQEVVVQVVLFTYQTKPLQQEPIPSLLEMVVEEVELSREEWVETVETQAHLEAQL